MGSRLVISEKAETHLEYIYIRFFPTPFSIWLAFDFIFLFKENQLNESIAKKFKKTILDGF